MNSLCTKFRLTNQSFQHEGKSKGFKTYHIRKPDIVQPTEFEIKDSTRCLGQNGKPLIKTFEI